MTAHSVLPDGYCETCRMVPCSTKQNGANSGSNQQLTRIETKLNKIMRAMNLETE